MQTTQHPADYDMDIVALWLRKDRTRWVAGILSGLFAGAVALAFAGIIAKVAGFDILFPARLMGGILLGPPSTDTATGMGSALVGFVVLELICVIFGFAYAHFVPTNSFGPLLAMGAVWGIFSWIFLWNLFLQSFQAIRFAQLPTSLALPVCLAYGLSLASVAFFDRMLRR
ncbi:MAG TPA: hypothetical protein VM598_09600 [Bdellovibrionota bacterium]|nr:hypothetical protein [Bdellovibrionota bacterium]